MRSACGVGALAMLCSLVAACAADHAPATTNPDMSPVLTREQLLDPKTCNQCHQDYFDQWSGSMHAYASLDPVFRAMNARGQRETNGDLGSFCVKCHAPMAVAEGATADGLNLDSVPAALQGVTCYFCHDVSDVIGTHDNPLKLANDTTMRGGIKDPVPYNAHHSAYSPLHDRAQNRQSASLCGSCHDIVVPGHFSGATDAGAPTNVAVERTYHEWLGSVFAAPEDTAAADPLTIAGARSCGDCHMTNRGVGTIANPPNPYTPMKTHERHSHLFAGVDTALDLRKVLTDAPGGDATSQAEALGLGGVLNFPSQETAAAEQATQLQQIGILLASELRPVKLCVTATGVKHPINVTIENLSAGHFFPSGASQDRRLWIEWHAYQGTGAAEHEIGQGGNVAPGQPATALECQLPTDPGCDPGFALIRDRAFKADGSPAHMFWDMARIEPTGTIPAGVRDIPNYNRQNFRVGALNALPDRVTVNVWLEPIGVDVVDDLISSEAPDVAARLKVLRAAMPRFSVGASPVLEGGDAGAAASFAVEWTKEQASKQSGNGGDQCVDSTIRL